MGEIPTETQQWPWRSVLPQLPGSPVLQKPENKFDDLPWSHPQSFDRSLSAVFIQTFVSIDHGVNRISLPNKPPPHLATGSRPGKLVDQASQPPRQVLRILRLDKDTIRHALQRFRVTTNIGCDNRQTRRQFFQQCI